MNNKNLNETESGRSMVEMLGVLAVMGLLTIIGIAGFKIAMNKAKANNLVADMNRLAHVVSMDKFSGYGAEAIQRAVAEHNATMALLSVVPVPKVLCEWYMQLVWIG